MGACLLPHHSPVLAAHSALATGSMCSWGLQAHPATFRFGTEDEATLASTSAFSTALIRWYLWRREASGWPFF